VRLQFSERSLNRSDVHSTVFSHPANTGILSRFLTVPVSDPPHQMRKQAHGMIRQITISDGIIDVAVNEKDVLIYPRFGSGSWFGFLTSSIGSLDWFWIRLLVAAVRSVRSIQSLHVFRT
jgi:hypothetical protein